MSSLVFGSEDIGTGPATVFLQPGKGITADPTSTSQVPMAFAGTVTAMFVRHNTAIGTGVTVTYTVMINNVASAITATLVTNAVVQGSDTVHTAAFNAGDTVALRAVSNGNIGNGNQDIVVCLKVVAS